MSEENSRCNNTTQGTRRHGSTHTIHTPGLSNRVQDPPKCGEPHRAVRSLFAQHGPQPAPQCSQTVHFHYTHSGLRQVQLLETQSASARRRAVMDDFGFQGFSGRDDEDRFDRPRREPCKRIA